MNLSDFKIIESLDDLNDLNLEKYTIINLKNEDFKEGTLIFNDDNLYINITEDIEFEPKPDYDFRPILDKHKTKAFLLGFPAAVIITGTNITIDLNGYTTKWSDFMCLMQRFGSFFELVSASFIEPEGPGDFGKSIAARNIIIKNGTIGKNPHHCIHGNGNINVIIENITFVDFEVVAIQLSGCDNVSITNCKIQGNRKDIPVNGKFSALRFLIQFAEELLMKLLKTSKRRKSKDHRDFLDKILDQLHEIIDMISDKYVKNRKIIFEDLVNQSGLIDGTAYGMSFGKLGVQIGDQTMGDQTGGPKMGDQTLGSKSDKNETKSCPYSETRVGSCILISQCGNNYPPHYGSNNSLVKHKPTKNRSKNITIKDCEINNISCDTVEYIGIRPKGKKSESGYSGSIFNDFSGSVYNYDTVLETKRYFDKGIKISNLLWYQIQVTYIANIHNVKLGVSNISKKMVKLYMDSFDFNYPNIPKNIGDPININIFTEDDLADINYELVSSIDSMNHIAKGAFGIRLDATDEAHLQNVNISNISNTSILGQTYNRVPYNYDNETLPGYKGCQTHGVSICNSSEIIGKGVNISNIHSDNGNCYGVRILNGSNNVEIDKIDINTVTCGVNKINYICNNTN